MSDSGAGPVLWAVSDLHVAHAENRAIVEHLVPGRPDDWLIVAGDVGERFADVEQTLAGLARTFAQVVWTPGNHELWTHPTDPVTARGAERYEQLVAACRKLGVLTPEDPFATWTGPGGPVTIASLFVGYDYSFLAPGATTRAESLRLAYEAGVVCADERFLDPSPHESMAHWCAERVRVSQQRLDECDPDVPILLVNHWPLTRTPTEILRYPEFAQWCGTTATADWHVRYRAAGVVYGHLHIPRVLWEDGVRTEEVSLGYPREWRHHDPSRLILRQILPAPPAS